MGHTVVAAGDPRSSGGEEGRLQRRAEEHAWELRHGADGRLSDEDGWRERQDWCGGARLRRGGCSHGRVCGRVGMWVVCVGHV